jgi:leucyl-tRNA synthetase
MAVPGHDERDFEFASKYELPIQLVVTGNMPHTFIHTYIHTCIHTCIHTYIQTYIHTYIHIL